MGQLHRHVALVERAEHDHGVDAPFGAEICRGGLGVDGDDADSGPGSRDLRLPVREGAGPLVARCGEGLDPPGRGLVDEPGVVTHHPRCDHAGTERAERGLDLAHPARRDGAVGPVVEERHDLALQNVEEVGRLDGVSAALVLLVLGRGDGPAVVAVEPLVPPSVEDGEVEGSVEGGLLPARSAGLLWAARDVEPDVAALAQGQAHGDVVVLHEHHPVADRRVPRELHHAADHVLATVVGRVGLARQHELHGPLLGRQQGRQPLGVREQQCGPLVGDEAPGEADGEDGGIEDLGAQARAHEADQSLPSLLPDPPDLVVAEVLDPGPGAGIGIGPRRQEAPGQKVAHLGRDPRGRVHAVGDRADGHLVRVDVGPQVAEHRPAHRAVQPRDAIGRAGQPEAHDRHVERGVRRLVRPVAQSHEPVEADPALLRPAGEVALHERA